ncbi:MAG TPA: hypothetical protein DCM58_05685, partial [Desulfovibrio sp.]|nr:hypothetical protein [Desulfovibrio sp.]
MGNLINRYRAVLRKCRVKNAMNRIVLAGALLAAPLFAEGLSSVTGGTGTAYAGIYSLDGQAQDFVNNGHPQKDHAKSSNLGITPPGIVGIEHADDKIYGGLATTPSSQSYNSIASGNRLTIEGDGTTSFSEIAIAGYASNKGSGSSTASNNVLTVTNALFDDNGAYITKTGIVGGWADLDVLGKDAIADNNTVTVQGEGSKVRIRVIGAKASNQNSQTAGIARADNNHVYIQDGARVLGAVLGAEVHGNTKLEEGCAEANNNTVEIHKAFIGEADGSGALYPVTGAYVHARRVQNSYGNKVVISDSVLSGGHGDEKAKSYVRALSVIAYADSVSTKGNYVEFSDSKID